MEEMMKGTLYIVGTPIGNLEELSPRARRILAGVDTVLCEDCRRTLQLFNFIEVKKPLVPYHKFNERQTVDSILAALKGGKTLALVTDAGLPCISDPGSILVAAVRENGFPVRVVSGPCAAVNAFAVSGILSPQFCFVGFLPEKKRDRDVLLDKFFRLQAALIFYIAPHDLERDLQYLYSRLGPRRASLARELTKLHEETVDFILSPSPDFVARGEYVLVVEGATAPDEAWHEQTAEEHLAALRASGMDKKEAVKTVAKLRGLGKNQVYQMTVEKKPQ